MYFDPYNTAVWIGIGTVITLVVSGGAYLFWLNWDAKLATENAPREEMIECHTGKHGPYPKKYGIPLSDLGTDAPVIVCPVCFEESMKTARTNLSKPGKVT